MVSVTLDKLWLVSDRIVNFRFFVKFHRSGPAIIFSFWTIMEHVSYPSKSSKYVKPRFDQNFIKNVSVTLEGLCMVSDKIVDFRFFVKFHRSRPAMIFSFLTHMEYVSHRSKKLIIKERFIKTSSRWWVLFWKDYWWFLIEVSILNFSSNFTSPDLQ